MLLPLWKYVRNFLGLGPNWCWITFRFEAWTPQNLGEMINIQTFWLNCEIQTSSFVCVFAESSISADSDCQSHVWRRLRVEEESGRGSDGRASRQRPTGNRQQRKRRHFRNATSPSATVSGENHGKPQINSITRKLNVKCRSHIGTYIGFK